MTFVFTKRRTKPTMTNFEHIKSMSVDELASLLGCISEDIDENMRTINGQMILNSIDDVKEWLESEHKDDDV